MRALLKAMLLATGALALLFMLAAKSARQLTGIDLAPFEGREVLVLRTSGGVPAPGTFLADTSAGTLSFMLRGVGADDLSLPRGGMPLVRKVELDASSPDGARITLSFSRSELADQRYFRFSQPSDSLVLLEVFAEPEGKLSSGPITDPEKLSPAPDKPESAKAPTKPVTSKPSPVNLKQSAWEPEQLGLTTVDLSSASAEQVLSLAAATGLLKLDHTAIVSTEGLGEVSVDPAGQSLSNWVNSTPPGELYLSGSPEQIAQFLKLAREDYVSRQPSLGQFWSANQPRQPLRALTLSATTGPGAAPSALRSRSVPQGDPYLGFGYTRELPGGGRLSDVRVTLPATSGFNLYDVLNYLSEVSGISIMIDPYAFETPTGSSRPPLAPERPANNEQAGFRPGSVFDPQNFRSGTVVGNLNNVPFDQALRLILETHELEYVVYGGEAGGSSGAPQESFGEGGYQKPVILVTSRERLEQELEGENTVELYQQHYVDPYELGNILGSLDMQPSGWYIYEGSGSGGGNGGSGGGGNGGSGGGGGGGGRQPGGGGAGGGGSGLPGSISGAYLRNADSGALFYRGSSRDPIYQRLREAVDSGLPVIRVKLAQESGMLVTGFLLPE
ncbi:STN domain-containing protein [bacterium]|nr:STN domain-containing protein [bacterium]